MDRKRSKPQQNKKNTQKHNPVVWYKKHFLLEVLYYVPYIYITLVKLVLKGLLLLLKVVTIWVKTYSQVAKDSIIKAGKYSSGIVIEAAKDFKNTANTLSSKITAYPINKIVIKELSALIDEVMALVGLISGTIIRLARIQIKIPHIRFPRFQLPSIPRVSINLSIPKSPVVSKVITTEIKEVKEPIHIEGRTISNPLGRIFFSVKSAVKVLENILLWPFRVVYKILKAIFTFEIRFRLFSFRTFLLIAFLVGLYLGTAAYFIVWHDLPNIEALSTVEPRQTTTIYDRKGNVLYRLYDDEDRTIVPLKSIPQDLINATIAIEDENFFLHKGLSVKGILRAAKKTFLEDNMEGGSTITQQLVKNSLLTSERTYERKAKEAIISIEVERKYSKEQILEMYMNRISYGGTAYGIKSAAKRYFNKELEELTLAETSFLAGLPASPSKYSPFAGNLEAGIERQKLVLSRMVASGFISQTSANQALEEKLEFKSPTERIIAPHFVNYVISELEDKYGQMMVAQGGLEIFTSIDLEMQAELENIVETEVAKLSRNNVSNGAALITDPETGEILAMVGSKDYWDTASDGNVNITISPRQPGSSIKPLTYSLALESGYTTSTIIEDKAVTYKLPNQADYKPVNYDGKFHGRVTLKQALANSYNIPAVKVLDDLGVSNLIEHGKNMGITTWNDSSRFGLSLTLGAGEVKMTDLAVAYGVFANQGYRKNLNPILKIYDTYGNIIEENDCVDFLDESPSILTRRAWFETNALASTASMSIKDERQMCQKERVLSPYTSYMISNILTDNRARSSAFGSNSELNVTKKQVAVKTGTTNNERDNWAIGYNDDYVIAAWVGNNYNEPMRGLASGYVGSSTIWRKAVDYLIESKDMANTITRPAGLVEVNVCPLTDTLACAGCPNIVQIYEKGKEPKYACDPEKIKEMLNEDDEEEEENSEDDSEESED